MFSAANRHRHHQLADWARGDGNTTRERKIREEITRSANFERRLSTQLSTRNPRSEAESST
ncbi:hypothetical protein C493_03215 [Natronolimnohabitans innermongolicus JCM 12255]|uniref:Uncharacterized protein n=1 Tax=Natronolimnohabitans innermongolicus JCM 12255 TaxID=1227499 RepID=L9XHA8_9EURY|nr:hypothetical protein C493_03215 [Natronolimnohabitans innermongolicus JCM 12255]